ncbi:ABC transporter permease [Eubacterium sp. 1001713B170207_170306_E7]|uniref:ABC transporter permease n=1 Tax=Eubacterium sp. 1001713B170207_170306_E7 TaxID=2787097 RepID=UPI001897CE87|nr:ABC transporter permease [Eubacterium sp. 1001713B170207_170306_E7]
MFALIKMEFYQLIRNKLFYLMAGVSVVFGALMCSGYIGDTSPFGTAMADGLSVFGGMVYDSTMWLIVTGAMSALMLGQSAGDKTLGLAIAAGHSRASVYFCKALVFLLTVNVVMFLYPFAGLVVTGLMHGFDKGVVTEPFAGYLLRVTGMVFLANCAVFSVSILLMAIFQDAAKTTACATLMIILEAFGMVFFLSRNLAPLWLPPYMARAAVLTPLETSQVILILMLSLGFMALLLGAGYCVFRKREIK